MLVHTLGRHAVRRAVDTDSQRVVSNALLVADERERGLVYNIMLYDEGHAAEAFGERGMLGRGPLICSAGSVARNAINATYPAHATRLQALYAPTLRAGR